MAEDVKVLEPNPADPTVTEEQVAQPAEGEPEGNEDREPSGGTPQEIRARKEYRARKAAQSQLQTERERVIALEARLDELSRHVTAQRDEAQRPTAPQPTKADIQREVDEGRLSPLEAADYLANSRAREAKDAAVREVREELNRERKLDKARSGIDAYKEFAPWIYDKSDSRRADLEREFARLTQDFELPATAATELLALERVLGPVDQLRKKAAVRSREDYHSESGLGGGAAPSRAPGSGSAQVDRMPAHFKDFWARQGTPLAEREKEAKLYFADTRYTTR